MGLVNLIAFFKSDLFTSIFIYLNLGGEHTMLLYTDDVS